MANKLCKCVLPIVLVTLLLGSCLTAISAQTDKIPAENNYALLCASTTFLYLLDYPEPARSACIQDYGDLPHNGEHIYDIRDILVNDYGWLPDHFTILLNEDNTKANVMQEIESLKQYDSPDSLFLIALFGHGWVIEDEDGDEAAYPNVESGEGKDPWDECWQPYDGIPGGQGNAANMVNFIIDDEFKMLFDELDFQGQLVVVFKACCGSGLIEDIAGRNRLAIGVGNADRLEMHWGSGNFLEGYFHGIDIYLWYALSGNTEIPYVNLDLDPDSNGDGKVSLEEACFWANQAFAATDPNIINYGGPVTMYMVDGIEGETFL